MTPEEKGRYEAAARLMGALEGALRKGLSDPADRRATRGLAKDLLGTLRPLDPDTVAGERVLMDTREAVQITLELLDWMDELDCRIEKTHTLMDRLAGCVERTRLDIESLGGGSS